MDNRWAAPEGFEQKPQRVKYRVRDVGSGAVVVRMTALAPDGAVRGGRYYHSLDHADQHLARKVATLVQTACTYFYEPDEKYAPICGVVDVVISDADVSARIARMDLGENSREAERVNKRRYVLTDLPWDQQRALVEQIEALKREWCFEFVGEATPEEEAEYNRPHSAASRAQESDDELRLAMGAYG